MITKIAVIVAGMPRNFNQLFPIVTQQLIEFNKNYIFDFYVSTSYSDKSNKSASQKLDNKISTALTEDEFRILIKKTYGNYLKWYELLPSKSDEFPLKFFNENKVNLYVYRCQKGLEEALKYSKSKNFQYDRFICMRTDIIFTKNIDLTLFNKPKTLYFICSDHTRPGFFHNRDWDFFCMGDYEAIKEWTKVWQYREDTIAHFPQPDISKLHELPKCAKGSWSKEEAESLNYKFAYRLVPSCMKNGIDIDICTAENKGLFAKMTPKYTKNQMFLMNIKQIIKKVLIAFRLWR